MTPNTMPPAGEYVDNLIELGCRMPAEDWIELNRHGVFRDSALMAHVGPFPPMELMQNTTGLTSLAEFASHGADFWAVLSEAAEKPLSDYASILDFGCGCGRLARMFKGHPGRIAGCDIDPRHVNWCASAIPFMEALQSHVHPPLPFSDGDFELVISISIFTHLTEDSQREFLAELWRVCRPDGLLLLTIHGERALVRAQTEPSIRSMIEVEDELFETAAGNFARGDYGFILQQGHLTTRKPDGTLATDMVISEPFEYGITFIPEAYLRRVWTEWFEIVECRSGAIHDFQDVIVLKPRPKAS